MSLPGPDDPRIPYVHGRDLVPIRRQPRRLPDHRRDRLFVREDELRAAIDDVDRQLVELTERRRTLLDDLGHLHDELRPAWRGCAGRRRRAVSHEEPLPPTVEKPVWLSGRELRAVCFALLARAKRALSLRQLHVLLHRAGYAVSHQHPVKALADALGHEADVGRVVRIARGVYGSGLGALDHPALDPPADDTPPSALPDW